ncbi:hypothetical protein C8Q80DRAFT_1183236 [Daedaleopsis nitida]|nr:hypothetical protein C8Q80DRAFT_1183236 [Daedaleopsis nitida]
MGACISRNPCTRRTPSCSRTVVRPPSSSFLPIDAMETHKRKRDDEGTIVTFYAPDRTFARVYKGQSFDETKDMVRKKLALTDDASIRFARLHEGRFIELDDDDDFEAFRHLAKHAASLDVSVMVGNRAPTILSRDPSASVQSPTPTLSRKRSKRFLVGSSPHAQSSGAVPPSGSVNTETASDIPSNHSTLDVHGVPKKKRKRNDRHRAEGDVSGFITHPVAACSSRKQSSTDTAPSSQHQGGMVPVPSTTAPSFSRHEGESSSQQSGALPRGSKRKRPESPEAAVEKSSLPTNATVSSSLPPPPPPSLSSKKQKVKPTTVQLPSSAKDDVESQTVAKTNKKRKAKINTDMAAVQPQQEEIGPVSSNRKLTKKTNKAELVSTALDGMQQSKILNHDKGEKEVMSESLNQSASNSTLKEKGTRQKATVAIEVEPSNASVQNVQANELASDPKKDKKPKSRKSKKTVTVGTSIPVESISGLATADDARSIDVTGKRSKGKEISQAEASVSGTVQIAAQSAWEPCADASMEQDAATLTSAKKPKRDRRKSASSGTSLDSASMVAAVQAAYDAVLARGPSASTSLPITSTAPTDAIAPVVSATITEPNVPVRKRNVGRSKLHKTWVPTDLSDEPQSPSTDQPNHAPTEELPDASPPKVNQDKSTEGKKTRPSVCPFCEEAASHSHTQCPVVLKGAASIRRRITQLKKAGLDKKLVNELEGLHKEAQKQSKITVKSRPVRAPAPIVIPEAIPAGEAPPSSPDLPLQSSSTSLKRPPLLHRTFSSPRFPAGSEISEVAVESKDEGSSNESSSSDDEDDAPPAPSAQVNGLPTDIESLLYAAKPGGSVLAQIPSSSESSDDESSDGENEDEEDVDLEEEEKNDRAFRRISRKFARDASSSSDEQAPQPEPDNAEADEDDVVVPPTKMDTDLNDSVEDARLVEEDVLSQEKSAVIEPTRQSVGNESESGASSQRKPGNPDDEVDSGKESLEQAKTRKRRSAREPGLASELSGESQAPSASRGLAAGGDDARRVERIAEVDPLASQESHAVAVEDLDERQSAAMQIDDGRAGADIPAGMDHAQENAELKGKPSSVATESPMDATASRTRIPSDSDQDKNAEDAADAEVEVRELHTEDPNDPISSFSTEPESARRDPVEDDSIEDFTPPRTPPPAPPRTPGTVSRMRDRHGRLSQARSRGTTPLPQLLGNVMLPDAELTLPTHLELATELQADMGAEAEAGPESGKEAGEEPEKTQEATQAPSQQDEAEEAETRPRRTSRTTRKASPGLSLPEPTPPPSSAPKRRGRLTEEEKAQRAAEKAEKAAERKRVAAEKKAAKEAEKEAKKAAKAAEKAAKEVEKVAKLAAQEAAQVEEPVKRGTTTRGRGRGRGRGVKPVSTRSLRSAAPVAEEERELVGDAEGGTEEPQSSGVVADTPGVSKISWTTLSQSVLGKRAESLGDVSSSVDELQPSSPESSRETNNHGQDIDDDATVIPESANVADHHADEDHVDGDHTDEDVRNIPATTPKTKTQKAPLFIPSSSQLPFTPFHPDAESTPFHDPAAHPNSDDEAEGRKDATFKVPSRPRAPWYSQSMYPSLTDIASQALFPATQIPSPALFSQTPKADASFKLKRAGYDNDEEDEDESSENADSSDSDAEDGKKKTSHIPQNRRAGAGVQKKKKIGLLAYA